ncbi:glycosyltransferase family 2 protein [Oerskovia enterophila]|uniref:glycosyltransferase family 2 protein n=1 Tax=Oerskovia enterophila TaxID=43678 RepID=UPI003804A4C9
MSKRLISYVLPVYNEGESIEAFYQALVEATDRVAEKYDFEFIFVDDGSRDNSLTALEALHALDRRVQVVEFSRNFGHQMAVTAGIDLARGDAVVIMDTDLQDPPSTSLRLIERWEAGVDVAYAQRVSRKDSPLKRWTAHAYYRLLSHLSTIEIPRDTGDFRLVSREVADELRKYREANRFVRGMVANVGFRQEAVPFARDARYAGKTGYSLSKMMRLAFDGILGFSTKPLQIISRLGVLISLVSILVLVYVVAVKLFAPESAIPGWAFLAVGVFFLGGVQISMLGVLGGYIGRIYIESQDRPLYIVRSILPKRPETASARSLPRELT